MNFNMTKPCSNCPFRTDVEPYLRPSRVEEIVEGITDGDQSFACHKTLKRDPHGEYAQHDAEEHCGGALILLEKIERPNQLMRIAERLGLYDRRKLKMSAPVYDSPGDMIAASYRGKNVR